MRLDRGLASIALVCAAACTTTLEPRNPEAGPWAPLALVELELPGPAPRPRPPDFDPRAANAECEACHVEIAEEWRGSLHRDSWRDPLFLAAYSIEAQPFCRRCHAPESPPERPPSASARDVGVGCVTCHVQQGAIVGAHAASSGAPHVVLADPRLATAQACAGCHEFDFPDRPGVPMQSTLSEHASSPRASEPCQSCHMPEVRDPGGATHRRHDFRVVSDTDVLRRAIVVEARRTDARLVEVELRRGHVGHAVPTGDMFRRLELRSEVLDAAGEVVAQGRTLAFARAFQTSKHPGSSHRVPAGDSRLFLDWGEASRLLLLSFPRDAEGRVIRYRLVHQRMPSEMARLFGVPDGVNERVLFEGLLAP